MLNAIMAVSRKKYCNSDNFNRNTTPIKTAFNMAITLCTCIVKAICMSAINSWLNVVAPQLNILNRHIISRQERRIKNCSWLIENRLSPQIAKAMSPRILIAAMIP